MNSNVCKIEIEVEIEGIGRFAAVLCLSIVRPCGGF